MTAQGPKRGQFEKVWFVPRRGVLRNLPIYEVPDDAAWDALNVLMRRGFLRPRPGMVTHADTDLLTQVMGAHVVPAFGAAAFQGAGVEEDAFQEDAFQIVGAGSSSVLLAATLKKIWAFFNGAWNDITNGALAGSASQPVRFTTIQIAGVIYTLVTNGVDAPRQWDNISATTADVAGSPPLWTDITTIANHIIGIVPPFTVQWGNNLAIDTWSALNFRDVADTVDSVVAIRNMGVMGGVLYKQKSLWGVVPVGGSEAGFFRVELRALNQGPVSPAAVVDADGTHYYLTDTGRVGMYDGTSHDWVADGVWEIVKDDLDPEFIVRAFGVYEPFNDEVYFYYPRLGDAGVLKGGLVVQRPRRKDGIVEHIAFPLLLARPISAGVAVRFGENRALLFTSDEVRSRLMDNAATLDVDAAFTGFWQPGLAPVPGQVPHRLEEVECFAQRGLGFGSLTMKAVTSNLLDSEGGTVNPTPATVDLADVAPVRDLKGFVARGRFLGLRHEFSTPITLRWQGSRLTADKLE